MEEELRSQRDRFMAFAFAVGDLLLEVDERGVVAYAIGAGRPTVGIETAALVGQPLAAFVADSEVPVLEHIVGHLREGERRGPLFLDLAPGRGRRSVLANAFRMPGPRHLLSLALSAADGSPLRRAAGSRDLATGLLGLEAFVASTTDLIRDLGPNRQPLAVSFLAFSAGEDAADEISAADLRHLAAALRTRALADLAAVLGTDRFAALHPASLSSAFLADEVGAVLSDEAAARLTVNSITIDPALSIDETVRAAIYGTHEFVVSKAPAEDLTSLAETLARRAGEAARDIESFAGALRRGELLLAGVPVVSLLDHAVRRVELLVRHSAGEAPLSHHSLVGRGTPLHAMDLAMVEFAYAYAASTSGRKATAVGVNIAAESLLHTDLVARLKNLLTGDRVDPHRIVFEVTVRNADTDIRAIGDALAQLRRLGAGVALDAFGTSAARLDHLRSLDLDEVKLCGHWIRSVLRSPRDAALVDAIAGYAARVGMAVTAMDVESLPLAGNLTARGLAQGQGSAFGHPIPIDSARLFSLADAANG